MARGKQNKLYRTFVKGLITEAGYLTYPENASIDELNTVIKRKGSRSRRLGFDYEPSSTAATVVGGTTDTVSEYSWRAVHGDSSINFLVVQIKGILYFFNMDASPISSGLKTFTVDLTTYIAPAATTTQVQTTPVQMASGKGFLFVAQEFIDPILIEYNPVGDAITTTRINVQVRDFDGVNDGLANDEHPTTLSKEHLYNLKNQGWVNPSNIGVVQGGGSTNPYTPPTPPPTTTNEGTYDPYTGTYRSYNRLATP